MKRFAPIKGRILHRLLFPRHKLSNSSLAFANDAMFLRSVVLFENWPEVAVAVLLNMLRRLQRDVGLAPAFTRMCRRRRHLPSWCLRSLMRGGCIRRLQQPMARKKLFPTSNSLKSS